MTKKKPANKKPSMKQIVNAVGNLYNKLNELEHQLTTNIGITNLYIEMNKDAEKFSQFVNDKIGVNDDKTEDAGVNEGDTIGSSTDER